MVPDNLKFGGGINESLIHPAVLLGMIIALALILTVPRKWAIPPFLFMVFIPPVGQQFVFGGLHFFVMRILVLAGVCRMLISKRGKWDTMDKLFVAWAIFRATAFILLFNQSAAVTNQLGFFWDVFGGYFYLRYLVQDDEDVDMCFKTLAVIAGVVAVGTLIERIRDVNIFGYLGGVPLVPQVRDGKIRSQGPFTHPLLAGSFGATLAPLFVWLWIRGKARLLAVIGIASSVIITITSASSTSSLALAAGAFGICLWPLRNYLRELRWAGVFALCGLSVVMKAPVWFILQRIDLVGGSSGYHRALLIDQFIRHFSDWWLVGTNDSGNWGYDLWDTANQYVTEGETGGLLTLIAFMAMIVISFQRLGKARWAADGKKRWYFWLIGTAVFCHVVAFFGISYFDQTRMLWFLMLAIIVQVTNAAPETPAEEQPASEDEPNAKWWLDPAAAEIPAGFGRFAVERGKGQAS